MPAGLLLNVSENAWKGDAKFTVTIDGKLQQGVYTATASRAKGLTSAVAVPGTLAAGSHTIGITFINDAYGGTPDTDRNLYVEGATLDGATITGSKATLLSNSTFSFKVTVPTPVVPATAPVVPVTQGSQINASNTGPAAIGINPQTVQNVGASLTIHDQNSASFIRSVSGTQTYDGFTVAGPHLLIQGADIHASIDDYSSLPLVILGSKIEVDANASWGIFGRASAAPIYLLNSDISTKPGVSSGELVWFENSGSVAYRNHIHGISDDGVQVGGGQNIQIVENLIDQWTPAPGAHTDGIQMSGSAKSVTFSRNKVILGNGDTGAINMVGWAGKTSNVTMDSNYLAGGGYTFYGPTDPGAHGNSFTNNVFGSDIYPGVGQWGTVYPNSWSAGDAWRNNTLADGRLVSATGAVSPAAGQAQPVKSTLVLHVSEDAWLGDAQYAVDVDGARMGTYTATALHGAGQSQVLTIAGITETLTPHDVAVSFINDAYGGLPDMDRNLYLNGMELDGRAVPGGSATFLSSGTQHFIAVAPANWAG